MRVTCLVGAQYGSEGKGAVVAHYADRFDAHVRVGGPNAGHSLSHCGEVFKMQAVPCGWVNKNAQLYIGAGAVVDPALLLREMQMIEERAPEFSVCDRLLVDPNATLLTGRHHDDEGGVEGQMHKNIGSTGEGVGAARLERMARRIPRAELAPVLAGAVSRDAFRTYEGAVLNFADLISPIPVIELLQHHDAVLLEGTQGAGLSLTHGPWPYCTSQDISAAQLCADAGIAPSDVAHVVLVVRTFPIRVAGNSGPMCNELTWQQVSKIAGREVLERTTVTKKVRRVSWWDEGLFRAACIRNKPDYIVMTFIDYLSPQHQGMTIVDISQLSSLACDTINKAMATARNVDCGPTGIGCMVLEPRLIAIGTGGPEFAIAELAAVDFGV